MRQIEIFLMTAKYHSISQAAKALYTSQSSVSNWIAKMEEDCGVKLFVRNSRGVVLTNDGEEIYAKLDVAYNRFRVSVADICRRVPEPETCLRLGFLHREEISRVTKELVNEFRNIHSEVQIEVEMYNFHELRDKLICGELDIAISASYDMADYSYCSYVPVGKMEPYFFIPPSWAEEKELSDLSFLEGKTMILEAPTHRETAINICKEAGFTPGRIRFANSYLYLNMLVSRGCGFSVDSSMREDTSHQLPVIMLPTYADGGKIVAAWRREELSDLAEKFLSVIEGQQN